MTLRSPFTMRPITKNFSPARSSIVFARLNLSAGTTGDQADAHVEGAQHFFLLHVAQVLQMLEDGGHLPGTGLHHGGNRLGEDAWQVLRNAAAGNMRHPRW